MKQGDVFLCLSICVGGQSKRVLLMMGWKGGQCEEVYCGLMCCCMMAKSLGLKTAEWKADIFGAPHFYHKRVRCPKLSADQARSNIVLEKVNVFLPSSPTSHDRWLLPESAEGFFLLKRHFSTAAKVLAHRSSSDSFLR